MAYQPISHTVPQYQKLDGTLASGYYLKGYQKGTTTPLSMATDATGGTTLVKCRIGQEGYPISNPSDETTIFTPRYNANYKLALYATEADADANNTANARWVDEYTNPLFDLLSAVVTVATVAAAKALTANDVVNGQGVYIQGYTAAGDDGGGVYTYNESSAETANDGTILALDTLAGRLIYIDRKAANAATFGAVGDGSTDDTAKFTSLESAITGEHVDLSGKAHLVTAIPTGNDYYNGSFKVGSVVTQKNRSPRSHPFASPVATVRFVEPAPNVYRGLNVAQFSIGSVGEQVYLWREAPGHGNENLGTEIKSAITTDHGYSFKPATAAGNAGPQFTQAYTISTADTRNFAAGPMNNRLGVVAARVEVAGTHLDPVFIYSDDDGASWSSSVLAGFTAGTWNFHSKILPYPASAGGNDTNGFICYFYKSDGSGIGALTTVDNGANWSETTNIITASSPFTVVTEISVARIGSGDQWVAAIRTGTGTNAAICTSTNMTTWTNTADSGLLLSGNPPELFYEDGKLWLIGFSRTGQAILSEYANAILISGANASTLFTSGGSTGFNGWDVLSALAFWPTGYISLEKIRDRWYGLFNSENFGGSTQGTDGYLMVLSSDALAPKKSIRPNQNLLVNGTLRQWPLGTSITGTARDVVVPGFTFSRASSVAGWTITRVTGDNAEYAMRIRRDDSNTATEEMILVANQPWQASKPLADKQSTISFRARAGSGFSAASGFLTVQLRQTNHTSEQVITTASGTWITGDGPVGTSASGVTLTEEWQRFKLTPGRINNDTTQLSVRIFWLPVGTASNDWIEIEEIKLEEGINATPFIYPLLSEEQSNSERFVQAFSAITPANTLQYYLFPSKMHIAPSVSVSAGSVSGSPTVDGFQLNNATGSPITSTVTAKCVF